MSDGGIVSGKAGMLSPRLRSLRREGVVTLALSLVVVLATAGASLALALARVLQVAIATPAAPARPVALVLVLGMMLDERGRVGPVFAERLQRSMSLPGAPRILILGGVTGGSGISEAQAGRAWLIDRDVEAGRVLTEDQSLNTLENLQGARKILTTVDGGTVLITSRHHLARAGLMAGGLGLAPLLCAAEARFRPTPRALGRCLVEAAFVNWYWCGRLWAIATGNRTMLDRIR